jgi:hypothetical protein
VAIGRNVAGRPRARLGGRLVAVVALGAAARLDRGGPRLDALLWGLSNEAMRLLPNVY